MIRMSMMSKMSKILLPLTFLVALLSVFFLTSSFEKNTTQFFGITDNHEQTVSFPEAVEITEIPVIEGQYVEQGSVLLKARRSELDVQQTQLSNQMEELNASQSESNATINAQISVLRAKKRAELAKIEMQIQQLLSRRQHNAEIYKQITGTALKPGDTANADPVLEQTRLLRRQKQFVADSIQAEINALKTRLVATGKPLQIKKEELENRLEEVNRQAQELIVRADFTGRIGSIIVKPGERIPAFKGVLTLHGLYPEYVKGYVHENVSNDAKIGQRVWVHPSYNHNQQPVPGVIESLGSRIVEYPERLKLNPNVRSWGREVVIRLENNNPLLLGEKVQISFSPERPNSAEAFFNPFGKKAEALFPGAFADSRPGGTTR